MNYYQSFRAKIQLSQSLLARWLKVSQSLINFAENGKRKLPSSADAQFFKMFQLLDVLPEPVPTWSGMHGSVISQPEKIEALGHKLQVCERDLQSLRTQKLQVESDTQKQERALAFGKTALEADFVTHDPRLKDAVERWFDDVRLKYALAGPRAIKQLHFQLEQKEREQKFLENTILDYAPGPY